jgi:hypothetical protein
VRGDDEVAFSYRPRCIELRSCLAGRSDWPAREVLAFVARTSAHAWATPAPLTVQAPTEACRKPSSTSCVDPLVDRLADTVSPSIPPARASSIAIVVGE